MKICQKCGNKFGFSTKINGKKVNLQNRRYCLDCSPFGKHNTRNLNKTERLLECKCKECGRIFKYKRKSGHTLNKCNSCIVNKSRINLKKKLVEFKGGKCESCGLKSDSMRIYDFHHIDPNKKEINISGSYCRSLKNLKEEVKKCLLLCSNCHRIEHERIKNCIS